MAVFFTYVRFALFQIDWIFNIFVFDTDVFLAGHIFWSWNYVGKLLGGNDQVIANHLEIILLQVWDGSRVDGQVLHVAQRDRLHDLVVDHDVKRNERRDARDHQQSDEATAQHAPKQGPHRVVASDAVLAKLRTHIFFLFSLRSCLEDNDF